MSPNIDAENGLEQFQLAYGAPWLDRDRRLQVDDPEIREGMIKALEAYTLIWRKGCTPPDSTSWTSAGNNEAFIAQTVVMTHEHHALDPGRASHGASRRLLQERCDHRLAQRRERPAADHRRWVRARHRLQGRQKYALASDFVRFLAEGWLAHCLDFAGERWLPPMRKLVEQPFWLDPRDPHRMGAAIQILTRPHHSPDRGVRDQEWRSDRIGEEEIWGNAVHRVAADGISPEQAIDEAIARIKQILSE